MEIDTFETTNISLATALLCPKYAVLGMEGSAYAEEREDVDTVTIIRTVLEPPRPGRKPICCFVLGCATENVLDVKVHWYDEGRLFVHPEVYDENKKRVVGAIRKTRDGKDY